ncbi:MAG: hypothetical protein GF317_00485 [Candidatus Lokiarchaeota archaeon]|nr:hypothetical protein [Candidatus Lokiarchaeota archaeon]MBD3198453.1 hypothetical protein [Candidatus Lokiarchaeota archaeon]
MQNKEERVISLNYDKIEILKTIPAIAYGILIIILSSLSHSHPVDTSKIFDIDFNMILHIIEYALFSFLLFFSFNSKYQNRYLFIFLVLFAISDEIHQYFVLNRFFDLLDIILDIIGGLLGYLIFHSIPFKYKRITDKS